MEAPIVQWIGRKIADLVIEVRILVGAQVSAGRAMKSLIFILTLIVILGVIVFIVFPDSLSKQNVSLEEKSPVLVSTSTTKNTPPPSPPSDGGFKPEGFKGPTGPPSVIGPPGPPPNY